MQYAINAAFSRLHGFLLIILVASWLVGLLLRSWLFLPLICLPGGVVLGLIIACLYRHRPTVRSLALVFLCLSLGAWRYAAVSPVGDPQAINMFIGQGQSEVLGNVADEPMLETNSTLLVVTVNSLSRDNGENWQVVHGEIDVQIPGSTFDDPYAPSYGDTIQLTGRLIAPPSYSSPEILASMVFPRLLITGEDGNPVLVALYQLRTTLAGILIQALPQPSAALLIALFLSQRTPALKTLIPFFNVTGTAHLIAPSGFKITVLVGLITAGTRWLVPRQTSQQSTRKQPGSWRYWLYTLLIILFTAAYTLLSGGGPAAMRAGTMGILLVLAPRLERRYNIFTALALIALLMSFFDPFVLWETGFQLSFIGTLGIALFTPFFLHLLRFLLHLPLGFHMREIIAVTLAAQVATLPILALSFNQISFIAPFANIISVPLLGILLALGTLICLGGLISVHLAIICGWLAWPLLWYITTAISWCAQLPGAYLRVNNLNPVVAWSYYIFLAWITAFLMIRWRPERSGEHQRPLPLLSQHSKRLVQGGLALMTILVTMGIMQSFQADPHLTIRWLISGNAAQGEALLLHTPNGQTALIDEDATSTLLATDLDTDLPFWQRSLSLVVLTDTSANNLAGLQDVITRYQVAQVVDGGMLHPSMAYALWRRTLDERNIPYTRVHQGATIELDDHVHIQVLWPPADLHKSSSEAHDNALVLRLLAPSLHILLLNSTALSNYALKMLPESTTLSYLQAEIVQISAEEGKGFPASLAPLLELVQPALVLVLPLSSRKGTGQPGNETKLPTLAGNWQTLSAEQAASLEIRGNTHGWGISPSDP